MSTLLGTLLHLLILQLSNQSIIRQQCNNSNLAESGQELQLMFTSNIRLRKKCDLSDFDCGLIVSAGQAGVTVF